MRILAIEGSSTVASVAICDDDVIIAEYTINYKKTHSQTLMPMIDAIMKMTEVSPESIDAIAVAQGPGSFTGLRIAAASAKGFAMAIGKPIIGVPTMDAMAVGHIDSTKLICPMLDARRTQVYTGLYEFENREPVRVLDTSVILVKELVEKLNALGREVVFLGDGIDNNKEYIENNINVPYSYATAVNNIQRASYVALLAKKYYDEGKYVSADMYLPDYLKESQAERELKEKQ